MQPFAGVSMPIHYALGVLGEHHHTRAAAGLFDVSHMGQVALRARSGENADAARALESLVPIDVLSLPVGRQRYAFFTADSGGVRDDLMVANFGSFLYLVVNAACAAADIEHLRARLSGVCEVTPLLDRSLLAIQGPAAVEVLSRLAPSVTGMRFMDAAIHAVEGAECYISRSGYTGEDGFEISIPTPAVQAVAQPLLAHPELKLIGLGARDSLRLEAGLCLYGHELSTDITPVEADLQWAIPPVRRTGGARAGGFPGADVILSQLMHGTARRRVGLRPQLRPVREGAALFDAQSGGTEVGRVTSGTYGPSARGPVAMGYVPNALAAAGTQLFADVRGQRTPVLVSELPFIPHRYHR